MTAQVFRVVSRRGDVHEVSVACVEPSSHPRGHGLWQATGPAPRTSVVRVYVDDALDAVHEWVHRHGLSIVEIRGPGEATTAEHIAERDAEIARLRALVETHEMAGGDARAELDALSSQALRSVAVLVPTYSVFAAIRSTKNNGAIELPGGKVEEGESAFAAACREAEEELGVPVEVNVCSLGTFLHVFRGRLWRCEAFLGDIHGAHVTGSVEGEATYATRDELLAGTYGPVVRRILAAYDERLRERGYIPADVIGDRVRRGES